SSYSPQWERLYHDLILNYKDIYSRSKAFDIDPSHAYPFPEKMLIIYAHDYRPAANPKLQEYIKWKEQKGFVIETKNLNSITSSARDTFAVYDVRDTIQAWFYRTIASGKYVLLVGDATGFDWSYDFDEKQFYYAVQCAHDSLIPTFGGYEYDYSYWKYLFSDYFYQLVAGTDSFPDLCIGRWCCRNSDELTTYVDKTISYEMGGSSSWHPERSLYVAYRGDAVGGTSFQDTKEYIASNFHYPYCELYADEGAETQDIINEIESTNGYGIVNYCGHGGKTSWAQWDLAHSSFTSSQAMDLENTDHYPIVYNMCCYNGLVADPSDWPVMVEGWTRNPDGGAAGAFGASLVSWISRNNKQDSAMFRAHFNQYLLMNCGMAINYGKIFILQDAPTSKYPKQNAWMYYWIGDPGIDVWRGYPWPTLDSVKFGSQIEVRIIAMGPHAPVSGTKVCIHRDGGGYHKIRYTDEYGSAYFPYPDSIGKYYVTGTNQSQFYSIIPMRDSFNYTGSFGEQGQPLVELIEWNLKPLQPISTFSTQTISYSVAGKLGSKVGQFIDLSVFDASGRRVRNLVSDKHNPGHYSVTWDCKDNRGLNCPSGVYFVRMNTEDFHTCKRTILIK
ncbi:hypothetical protein GF359_01100, partial [candidate division WOR-3 bacterium]|nr:hypothetical protein [candidate division WOR-3 bacterium]MBD3363791.1 hypothetical protein [candidate division WOR-3 bacterium]